MSYESQLFTQFHEVCRDVETLALKSVHDIELPLCSFLIELTSSDCLKILKSEPYDWSNQNQPSMEKILLNYILTDYISCGLSSPTFYTVFHSTLPSKKSKIKLLKKLTIFWDCLFQNYKITSLNIEFIKNFIVILERLFLKISNSDSCIKVQCFAVLSRLKHNIQMYDLSILDSQILQTVCDNNIKEFSSNKKIYIDVENIFQRNVKVNSALSSPCLQTKQNNQYINNQTNLSNRHKVSMDIISHQTSTPLLNDEENLPIKSTKLNSDNDKLLSGQKVNAFQIMMFNAKRRQTKAK